MRDTTSPEAMLESFRKFDEALFAVWGPSLENAIEPIELGQRTRAVIVVALDSVVHWSLDVIERHIEEAFDQGSNVPELIEAILHVASLEGGTHALHDGLEALEMVIRRREANGQPVPFSGEGLGPNDLVYEATWPVPPVLPYHSPAPRYHSLVLAKYHPDLWTAFKAWQHARFTLRKELTRRTQELLVTASDVAIFWPEPLLDHHMHAAFEVGSTAQEILEVTVLAADVVQGARRTNFAGRILEGGVQALHHGITALERVLAQRESHGLLAPRDRTSPKVGRIAFTDPDPEAEAIAPTMRGT